MSPLTPDPSPAVGRGETGESNVQRNMRSIALGLLVVFTTGCESTRWNWLKPGQNNEVAAKPGVSPTVQGLVDYLNDNARRVQSLRVDEMSVDAAMGSQTVGLRGVLLVEKPRNFRMKARLVGKDEVDIGSNNAEFWFWALRNPDPYQYFCSYKDFSDGRAKMMPLPIQPEWVMESLGLGPYGPADKYKLEPDGPGSIRLVEKTTSPLGFPVRKVIVMKSREMTPPQPQVTAFLLLDDRNGQEICSAHILSTKKDQGTGAILPHKMDLRVPSQKMSMALKLDDLTVNRQIVNTAFQRQPMTGVDPFNLATNRIEPWGTQRTQGFNP